MFFFCYASILEMIDGDGQAHGRLLCMTETTLLHATAPRMRSRGHPFTSFYISSESNPPAPHSSHFEGTYHWSRLYPQQNCTGSSGNADVSGQTPVDTWQTEFHEYAAEWEPGYIAFLVDGKPYVNVTRTSTSNPKGYEPQLPWLPFYMQLNTAIGGPVRSSFVIPKGRSVGLGPRSGGVPFKLCGPIFGRRCYSHGPAYPPVCSGRGR